MTGVSTYGASTYSTFQVTTLKAQMQKMQNQITSGLVSQDYAGIADQAQLVQTLQTQSQMLTGLTTANTANSVRLDTMSTALSSIQSTLSDFSSQLSKYINSSQTAKIDVGQIQEFAFNALKSVEGYLNTQANGTFVFGGGADNSEPFLLGVDSLSQFQQKYDGAQTQFPGSAAADIVDLTSDKAVTGALSFDSTNGTITAANPATLGHIPVGAQISVKDSSGALGTYTVAANTGTKITIGHVMTAETGSAVTLTRADKSKLSTTVNFTAPDTITAATAGALTQISAGDVIGVAGASNGVNNGGWKVVSNDGTTLKVQPASFPGSIVSPDSTATVSVSSLFRGVPNPVPMRIDTNKTLTDLPTATDPAIEKAVRALGMIAQGAIGTPGALETNTGRAQTALLLVQDALQHTAPLTGALASESPRSLQDIEFKVTNYQKEISDITTTHKATQSTIQSTTDKILSIDQTNVIMQLVNQQQALQASYQSIAKVSQMSLLTYLGG